MDSASIIDTDLTPTFFRGADEIKKYGPDWTSSLNNYKKKINEITKSNKKVNEKYPQIKEKYKFVISTYSDLTKLINHKQREGTTLLSFIWDSTTPFFSAGTDSINTNFKRLKSDLQISNDESSVVENKRSSMIKHKENPPILAFPVVQDNYKFPLGKSVFVSRINKPQLAFIVDKNTSQSPIEINKLYQSRVESFLRDDSNNPDNRFKIKENEFRILKDDTFENRMSNLNNAFDDFFEKITAHNIENTISPIKDVLIFANPLMAAEDSYTRNSIAVIEFLIKKHLVRLFKSKNENLIPRIKIYLLEMGSHLEDYITQLLTRLSGLQ